MKLTRARLARRYVTALRAFLRTTPASRVRPQRLGRDVLSAGFATLDLVRMHEEALFALTPARDFANPRNGSLKRAGLFFTQALIPLEAAQRATRQSNRFLRERNDTLRLHTAALAAANRRLHREVIRRRAGETALLKGRAEYQKLLGESQVMQRKLRLLTRQIISAQEEERKEISRELHDEVVQTLVGINVALAALGSGASTALHTLRAKITRTQRLVENSINAVHQFARELRPAVLDDLGLIPALHAYSKGVATRKKILIQLTAFGGVEALGGAERTVLYRVAQEALTNVARHAGATQVRIDLTAIPGAIRMDIADNGKSFAVERVLLARNQKRLGLIGMKERLEMVGGRLAISSVPGTGTTVRAEIPFKSSKPKS